MNEFLPKKIIIVFADGGECEVDNINYYYTQCSEYPDKSITRVNFEAISFYKTYKLDEGQS